MMLKPVLFAKEVDTLLSNNKSCLVLPNKFKFLVTNVKELVKSLKPNAEFVKEKKLLTDKMKFHFSLKKEFPMDTKLNMKTQEMTTMAWPLLMSFSKL